MVRVANCDETASCPLRLLNSQHFGNCERRLCEAIACVDTDNACCCLVIQNGARLPVHPTRLQGGDIAHYAKNPMVFCAISLCGNADGCDDSGVSFRHPMPNKDATNEINEHLHAKQHDRHITFRDGSALSLLR